MSERPIRFLSVEDVLRLHALAIADQGGDPSMRDRGLLESAIAMPKQQFDGTYLHTDVPSMAAAYGFHICKNHPFVDGNKRAAVAAMIAFLSDNHWKFDASADVAEPVILRLASGGMNKEEFTAWVRTVLHAKSSMELRDFFQKLTFSELVSGGQRLGPEYAAKLEEVAASSLEAEHAIPLLAEIRVLYDVQAHTLPEEAKHIIQELYKTFVALYRIAEDMGYEW